MTLDEIRQIKAGDIVTVRFQVRANLCSWANKEICNHIPFDSRNIPFEDVISVESPIRVGDKVKHPNVVDICIVKAIFMDEGKTFAAIKNGCRTYYTVDITCLSKAF